VFTVIVVVVVVIISVIISTTRDFLARAVADATQATSLKPHWSKAYSRLGAALFLTRKYDMAEKVLE
jgi:hypothetical protein